MKRFKKVLVANRGEIAVRIFRACAELSIRTVAIYSKEDRFSLFRTKADESYLIGKNKGPVEAYLDINEIISLALTKGVDAIHPGYGFLAENPEFARKCADVGIEFIGPTHVMMDMVGNKIKSKIVAKDVGVPTIPGIDKPLLSADEAVQFADKYGYPVILKAAAGGGGRGMRVATNQKQLVQRFNRAKSEAGRAFGSDEVFIEKYMEKAKHIEVQVLGDKYGNIVHLYERDCSIQRRHQKVIEFAPAFSLSTEKREAICQDALKIARAVNYQGAGTVEFLVDDQSGDHYFIEVNPRIQVEHTVTEMVTDIDIVQSQLLVAQGFPLNSSEIGIYSQGDIKIRGYSIQCRVTTEDPANNFLPSTGQIDVYRTGSGFGIRLDGAEGFTSAKIGPYYDNLLVKIIAYSRTFEDVVRKSTRALRELTITGIKTNVAFLINVLNHPQFLEGNCDTNFINNYPELFDILPKADDELRVLKYIGSKLVNEPNPIKQQFDVPVIPKVDSPLNYSGTKQLLDDKGPEELVKWIRRQKKLLLTDNTLRDAHQSLMAGRLRTRDMLRIAEATAVLAKDLFSLEMWGGATYYNAYKYLKESPWERLEELRSRIPNILFQMVLRGSNIVGYKNYPDNVVREFIKEAAKKGIDVFRIFDSLNWLKGMEIAIDQVLKEGKIAEACICYTGDILDSTRDKYSLKYYIEKAKEIEKMGVHILCIKDMSALLKPYAAVKLIKALKEEISLPIHLHTHDTGGNGVATVLMAAEAGVDIVDTAFNSMSGLTSQPALNSIVAAMTNTCRDTGIDLHDIQQISEYWSAVRPIYAKFETPSKTGNAEIYSFEMPEAQYANVKFYLDRLNLRHLFREAKQMYKTVNDMLGDIVKAAPSSNMVAELAIFMVRHDLTPENIYEKGKDLVFPQIVVDYFKGMMGQPDGGFPEKLQQFILKGEKPIICRPGEVLQPADFDKIKKYLEDNHTIEPNKKAILSYALFPDEFEKYLQYLEENGDFKYMNSDVFFYGMDIGQTCDVDITEGKTLVIKLLEINDTDEENKKAVVFEVNSHRREVKVPVTNPINLGQKRCSESEK